MTLQLDIALAKNRGMMGRTGKGWWEVMLEEKEYGYEKRVSVGDHLGILGRCPVEKCEGLWGVPQNE